MTTELTYDQFKSTFDTEMIEVTEADNIIEIWSYVEELVKENIVSNYVLEKQLIEMISINSSHTFYHLLLPTADENIFIVIIVEVEKDQIMGHYRLDLEKEYGLK